MAQITFNSEYNYWDILVNAGIQPSEQDKYEYSEQDDTATLIVHDVSQQQLDNALVAYDHQKFLDGLPKPQATLEQQVTANTDYLLDVDFRLIMVELGLI